ncbi:TcaA NTF2-like domain-containing protein [Lederbergia citrea]|uniref:TcaA NTF2-like domain-containing protein n=1 Tax=Lederbergia citrea TaxID=2833581 RepID=UPI001BC8DFDC|nr:hypothetical protein [Lederbergia citrea]MBS4178171.1 hypothetical protein [Lederbergia citrea]
MNRFCQECGHPIKPTDHVCTECGTRFSHIETHASTVPTVKQPMTKKQKIITSIAAAVILLFSSFYIWGNSYVSADNTTKRFYEAISKKDPGALQKLALTNHGKFITKAEAKALLALAQEDNNYMNEQLLSITAKQLSSDDGLFHVIENGKWLGIFKRHSILLKSQYAKLRIPFEGVKNTFNSEEFPIKESGDNWIVYGPIAPGVYELESSYKGDFTEVSSKEEIVLADEFGEWTALDVELEASYVTLEINNRTNAPLDSAYIELNGNKVEFDEFLKIDQLGPFKLDGSTSIFAVLETPWGKVESEKVDLTNRHHQLDADVANDELIASLSDTLVLFGEESVQASAAWDVSVFTTLTKEYTGELKSDFNDNDEFFTGQLESIEINFDSLYFDTNSKGITASLPVKYILNRAYHELSEKANLEKVESVREIVLHFNPKEKKWLVNSSDENYSWFDDFTPTKTIAGSKKLYTPSETVVATAQKAQDDESAEEISDFIVLYNELSVSAINNGDFSIVSGLIDTNGPRYKQQSDYLDYLESKGITEEHLSTSVESSKKIDNITWEVVTVETFLIITPDSSREAKFRTKNLVKKVDEEWQLHKLLDTKEL